MHLTLGTLEIIDLLVNDLLAFRLQLFPAFGNGFPCLVVVRYQHLVLTLG